MKTLVLSLSITTGFIVKGYADNYYLGPWVWNITETAWEAPHQDVILGAIDLRSNTDCGTSGPKQSGLGLFDFSVPVTDPSLIALGADLTASIAGPAPVGPTMDASIDINASTAPALIVSTVTVSDLQAMLKLPQPLAATTYQNAIWETLTTQADPTGIARVKPLMPTTGGDLQMFLSGKLVSTKKLSMSSPEWDNVVKVAQLDYEKVEDAQLKRKVLGYYIEKYGFEITSAFPGEPYEQPTSAYWENWDCGNNNADVGCQQSSWPIVGGSFKLNTKQVLVNSNNQATAATSRCQQNLSGSDMLASVFLTSMTLKGVLQRAGITLRFANSASTTCYLVQQNDAGSGVVSMLTQKIVSGVATNITSLGNVPDNNTVIQGRVTGSTLTAWWNGTFIGNATDTAITGNTMAGVTGQLGAGAVGDIKLDNFYAADVPGRHRQWIGQ